MRSNWDQVTHHGGGTYASPRALKNKHAAKPKAKPKATFAQWWKRRGKHETDAFPEDSYEHSVVKAVAERAYAAGRRSKT